MLDTASVQGFIHLACAFPFIAAYPLKGGMMIWLVCSLVPITGVVLGYFPGNRLGFGGRESTKLMRQWSRWARSGRFDLEGVAVEDFSVSPWTGPVLSISFAEDDFASQAAVDLALSSFSNAQVTRRSLGREVLGDNIGHVKWARAPEPVAKVIIDWLN